MLILNFVAINNYCQKTEDVLYLKNGSIIRGKIISNKTDSIFKIQSKDGNIWAFKAKETDSIKKEKYQSKNEKYVIKKTGFSTITDIGLFLPLKESSGGYLSFGVAPTYFIFPNFSAGFGLNLDLNNQTYFPVYADLHYYINRKNIAHFLQFSIGHAFPKEKEINIEYRSLENKGGLYIAAGFGIELPQNENTSILMSFTYRYQQNNYKSKPGDTYYELIDKNNRYAIKFGLLFR
jgi:hypothetical protein